MPTVEPLKPMACKLNLPLPTPAWLQCREPTKKQDIRVGTEVCVFTLDGTTKGPSGLINGRVEISPRWLVYTGWDDEARTAFLLLVPREWTTLPMRWLGFFPSHRHIDEKDFPIPVESLDQTLQAAEEEWEERVENAESESKKWMGRGGVRVFVETRILEAATW